jgi:hypothetical protein
VTDDDDDDDDDDNYLNWNMPCEAYSSYQNIPYTGIKT